jgi:hypothetical protein
LESRSSVIDQKQLFDSWDETRSKKKKPGRWWRFEAGIGLSSGSLGGILWADAGSKNGGAPKLLRSTAEPRTLNGWNMCIGENFEAELVTLQSCEMVKEIWGHDKVRIRMSLMGEEGCIHIPLPFSDSGSLHSGVAAFQHF